MSEARPIRFELDGEQVEVDVDPLMPLRSVIADVLGRSAVVEPCGVGACGACTVLLDGSSALACLTPVGLVEDRSVTTIHGLSGDDRVVTAFVDGDAFQCGYCIPGFVLATHGLLKDGVALDRDGIVSGLAGNLCRCSSYAAIIKAAEATQEG